MKHITNFEFMITEIEKDKALKVLEQYETEQKHTIRDSIEGDCPSKDYEAGEPNGECESDGHYMCSNCVHCRKASLLPKANKP